MSLFLFAKLILPYHSVDGTVKTGGGASGHDVQNTYKNTAPILLEAVLCVRLTAYYVITPELEHRKSGYVERKRRPYQGNVVRIA